MSLLPPFAGRIEISQSPVGSGCVVHPSGLVATCWHVVSPYVDSLEPLRFATLDGHYKFPIEMVRPPDLRQDLVLLRPASGVSLPELATARLLASESALPGDIVTIQGFGKVDDPRHRYDFLSATGRVIGPAQRDGISVIEIESRQVLRGMSGAGVALGSFEGVVGLLSGRYIPPPGEGWFRDTGWVIPAEQIVALSQGLLSTISLTRKPAQKRERHSIWQVRGLQRAAVFVGREREVDRLKEILHRGVAGTVVISGIGGAGKTRLALEYAHRLRHDYDTVWLVRADFLAADLRELATALGLEKSSDGDLRVALNGWLANHSRWLIILDGADDPAEVQDSVPVGSGHVIITSRDASWGNIAVTLAIDTLQRSAAMEFLQGRGLQAAQVELDALADSVGDLPLALEHAASFILATKRPIREYIELLHHRAVELLSSSDSVDYPTPIATTWSVSFERLRGEAPAALEVLRLAAFLSQDDLPLSLLASGASEMPRRFRSILSDPLRLAQTVGFLKRYSLAEVSADAISIHPLVQTVVRDISLTSHQRADYAARAVRMVRQIFPNHPEDVDYWPECGRLATHALSVTAYADQLGVEPARASWLLAHVGIYLERRVDEKTAYPYFERSVVLAERSGGRNGNALADRLNNLGCNLIMLDQLTRAKEIFERVLEIDNFRKRRYREPVPAGHMMNYGATLIHLAEESEGEEGSAEFLEQGMSLLERSVLAADQTGSYFGVMLTNLADQHLARGDLDRASDLARLAERAERDRVGVHHPAYAAVLRDTAQIALAQGDVNVALQMLRDSAEINMQRLGPGSWQTFRSYRRYFEELRDNSRSNETLELADWLRENLDFGELSSLGVDTGCDFLCEIGMVYLNEHRIESALECFYEAAAVVESEYGPNSWIIALVENNIGFALLSQGHIDEAKRTLEHAVSLADPKKDSMVPVYEANYAIALASAGDHVEAMAHVDAALEADAGRASGDHGYILIKVARAEIAAGQLTGARMHLEQALDLLSASQLAEAGQEARREQIAEMLEGL